MSAKRLGTDDQERGEDGAGRKKPATRLSFGIAELYFLAQLDLRSIGEQALSDDLARNTKHEVDAYHIRVFISLSFLAFQVEGPLVLQVQRVRNVALPSTKQFSSGQSSRRLVRVQLTDGRVSLAGVEMEGAIANLRSPSPSPPSPPFPVLLKPTVC